MLFCIVRETIIIPIMCLAFNLILIIMTAIWQTKYHELGHAYVCKKMKIPHFICLMGIHKKSGYDEKRKTDVYYFSPGVYFKLYRGTNGICFYDPKDDNLESRVSITWGGLIVSLIVFISVFLIEILLISLEGWLFNLSTGVMVWFFRISSGLCMYFIVSTFLPTIKIENKYIKEIEKAKKTGEKANVYISDGTKIFKKSKKEWMAAYKKYYLPNKELFYSYEDRLKQAKEYCNK